MNNATMTYETGRFYDFPQVLEITEVKSGWVIDDHSRQITGLFVPRQEYFSELGEFLLACYDHCRYEELSPNQLIEKGVKS